ncbi:DUF6252 family protein [Chitinophaga sp. Cy-1792]|uniref:DUF6252 family protein n=1 Tax=Chitinophaga sp. Cy-1792 TaxID=2608339 RepID=UPI00141F79E3|nr:DUF6252 family protein [Chitinophaga sp. Cy-1792]NIG54269.1 hypothetical protein [Chitinophaga sp. Cy-1792]
MKYFILPSIGLLAAGLMLSCGGSHDKTGTNAAQVASEIQSAEKAHTPGAIATSASGYYMKAKLDSKDWSAAEMLPVAGTDRVLGKNNGESISIPVDTRQLKSGAVISFGEGNAVDLSTNDDVGIWAGKSGEMTITKMDKDWIEGTFHFTATSSRSSRQLAVTDGVFRVAMPASGNE